MILPISNLKQKNKVLKGEKVHQLLPLSSSLCEGHRFGFVLYDIEGKCTFPLIFGRSELCPYGTEEVLRVQDVTLKLNNSNLIVFVDLVKLTPFHLLDFCKQEGFDSIEEMKFYYFPTRKGLSYEGINRQFVCVWWSNNKDEKI